MNPHDFGGPKMVIFWGPKSGQKRVQKMGQKGPPKNGQKGPPKNRQKMGRSNRRFYKNVILCKLNFPENFFVEKTPECSKKFRYRIWRNCNIYFSLFEIFLIKDFCFSFLSK